MRLDLFLKKTAIIKRRTIAKEIVEKGKIFVNGKTAKPSTEVKNGNIIKMFFGAHTIEVRAIIDLFRNKEVPSFEVLSDEKSAV